MTHAMDAAIASVAGLPASAGAGPGLEALRAAWGHYTSPGVRVAVVGPFNQGKSTLLNALLGSRALPVDIVPSTGGVITVSYGDTPETRVTLTGGDTLAEPGFGLLARFAVLDASRRMREDVAGIELRLPHPLLARGVTLLDLPGTNDRQEQNAVVRDALFSADLVVHLLNARQLFTLAEQAELREWLFDRGISQVAFVLNFMNLVEPEDQDRVWQRAVDAARALTGQDPPPLHRVDALAALRARTAGDDAALQASGLAAFAAMLDARVDALAACPQAHRAPRVRAAAERLAEELDGAGEALRGALRRLEGERADRMRACDAASAVAGQRVAVAVARAREPLSGRALQRALASSLASALDGGGFDHWRRWVLEPHVEAALRAVNVLPADWCGRPVNALDPCLPGEPYVYVPGRPDDEGAGAGGVAAGAAIGAAAGSIFPIVGTFLGMLAGAAAGAARAGALENERKAALARWEEEAESARNDAARQYLDGLARSLDGELDAHAAQLAAALVPSPEPATAEERRVAAELQAVHRAGTGLRAASGELEGAFAPAA
jgi:hypothetical protein